MSKASSINPVLSSSVVSWSFCSKSQVLELRRAQQCRQLRFWRDNVRLPQKIITIIYCVSAPMPAPNTSWVLAQSCSVSTQSQLSVHQYQLSMKLAFSSKWQKSRCHVTLQEKWLFECLLCISRIGAHNNTLRQICLSTSSVSLYRASSSSSSVWNQSKPLIGRPELGQSKSSRHCSNEATNIL